MPSAAPYHRNSDDENQSGPEEHSHPTREGSPEFSRDSSAREELGPDDFPTYFSERDGRLFHSSTTSPYPLPADAPEQERLRGLHALVSQLVGANYIGPVPEILARDPNRQKRVLDLCNGTGTWVMEMAEDFRHVLFTGIDIVPIATRYPLPNVDFEIGDITEEFEWQNSTFDFIHARNISWAVHDYNTILPEVVRVLRSGGLFLSGEWDVAVCFPPSDPRAANPTLYIPASMQFYQVLNLALEDRGIRTVVRQIPNYLNNTGAFREVVSSSISVPVGTWSSDPRMNELGRGFLAIQSRFADSIKPFLRQMDHAQAYVDALVQNFVEELRMTDGLVGTYHLVYAIKAE